jgi:hypothetical protein
MRLGRFLASIVAAMLLAWDPVGAAAAAQDADAVAKPVAEAQELRVAGIGLPRYVYVPAFDAHLRVAGAFEVDRRYLPFHVSALYVGPGEIDAVLLADGRARCRIAIHWLTHALEADGAREYWSGRIEAALPDPLQRARLAPTVERLVGALGDARRGDLLTFDYDPESGLTVSRNGEVAGRYAGLEFNRTLLGLWLGPAARTDEKAALLGQAPAPVSDALQ